MGLIKLKVPDGLEWLPCRLCGAEIAFLTTANGDMTVVDRDGNIHSSTCAGLGAARRHFNDVRNLARYVEEDGQQCIQWSEFTETK